MESVCIFCGTGDGSESAYREAAATLGRTLATKQIEIVYGGDDAGMLAAIANAGLDAGGEVRGIMTERLADEGAAHPNLTELEIVDSMSTRNDRMAEVADAFVALPGGVGTLNEFITMLAQAQMGIHEYPCGLLNTKNYYDNLLHMLQTQCDEGFLQDRHKEMVVTEKRPAALVRSLEQYTHPQSREIV